MTRSPWSVLALSLLDGAIGALILREAIAHGDRRGVLVQFFVYATIILFFKARDAARRLPALVAQSRASDDLLLAGPWWVRTVRALVGYDSWSRTERLAIIVIAIVVTALFGWARGGPFAAALFIAVAVVDGVLALVALAARASRPKT
jgi:hypothetical protein